MRDDAHHVVPAGNLAQNVYHAQVDIVGYAGERCVNELESSQHVSFHLLGSPFARLPRALFLLYAPLKVIFQVCCSLIMRVICLTSWQTIVARRVQLRCLPQLLQLLWTLLIVIPPPRAILVQNPPRSVPTCAICCVFVVMVSIAKCILRIHHTNVASLHSPRCG